MVSNVLEVYFGRNKSTTKTPLHRHEHWQLEIVTNGMLRSDLSGEMLVLEAGDMLLVPPGQAHQFVYEKPDISWITLRFLQHAENPPLWGGVIRSCLFTERLISSFRMAIRGSVNRPYENWFVGGFLNTVLGYMRSDDFHPCADSSHRLITQIRDKVLSRNGKAITVNDLADELSYTRSHLSKLFKDKTGESLKAYIDKMRIQKAEEMLQYREFGITEIAADLGFEDIFSFSRFFKKHTGVSPREFKSR